MVAPVLQKYDARLDAKSRLTIRGAESQYYAVTVFNGGRVVLEPRVLVPPEAVSKRTLKMLDGGAKNFKKRKVSPPVELDKYL